MLDTEGGGGGDGVSATKLPMQAIVFSFGKTTTWAEAALQVAALLTHFNYKSIVCTFIRLSFILMIFMSMKRTNGQV